MAAGRIATPTQSPHDGVVERVLNQRGLARAAHTGDDDESIQGKLDIDVLEIIGARTFEGY